MNLSRSHWSFHSLPNISLQLRPMIIWLHSTYSYAIKSKEVSRTWDLTHSILHLTAVTSNVRPLGHHGRLKFLLLVHKIAKYDGIQRNLEQTP